jgi:hypothetical protein
MSVFLRVQSVKLTLSSHKKLDVSLAEVDSVRFQRRESSSIDFSDLDQANSSTSAAEARLFQRRPPGLLKATLELNE